MTAPYPGNEARRQRGVPPSHHSDTPPSGSPGAAPYEDLWSAPRSAVPIDGDLLDGQLFGSWASSADDGNPSGGASVTPTREQTESDRDPRTAPVVARRRHWSTGLALVLALTVLIGLGLLARQLDAPTGSDGKPIGGQPAASRGANPSRLSSPIPISSTTIDLPGSADCPMRLGPDGQVTRTPSPGGLPCFFIG
jgi:hypothetical protein